MPVRDSLAAIDKRTTRDASMAKTPQLVARNARRAARPRTVNFARLAVVQNQRAPAPMMLLWPIETFGDVPLR